MEKDIKQKARLAVKQGTSVFADAQRAVRDLHDQIVQPEMDVVILFCSPEYDLGVLGRALREQFPCPILGCTTAGEISSAAGYIQGGLVGASLRSDELIIHRRIIQPLDDFSIVEAEALAEDLQSELQLVKSLSIRHHFGFLLVDGMSMREEETVALLHTALQGLPLIGGSAGDGLSFGKTWIYEDGRFISNAAVYTLFETTLPFETFRIQHFEPTATRLVITESNNATRTVYEINGMPAAEEYARSVGLQLDELSPFVFAAYPVMLRIGDEYYVRSIQKMNEDGSLTFFCAIDNGLVLTVARGVDLIENLKAKIEAVRERTPHLKFILGCDCILRRLEMEQKKLTVAANAILRGLPFLGFSTYGEQYNGIHVNQTLTGIALGGGE